MRRLRALAGALLLCSTVAISPAYATDSTCGVATTTRPASAVWDLARQRLTALIPGPGFPFGSTGHSAYARTTARSWTSGFFPTSLWLLYRQTQDPTVLAAARRMTTALVPVSTWTGTHDLGFMIGLPMRAALATDPDAARLPGYRAAMLAGARSLASRWNPRVRAVKSADYSGQWGLIIDSAMNVPLLIEAGTMIGGAEGARLSARGLQHMVTLASNLLRPNGSTVHRMAFDPRSGRRLGPLPGQGQSTTSTWARGQAWAVNGFTQAYILTRDARMLAAARATARYWMTRVPAGCLPAWDLDVADRSAPRDTSAAAIAADGLLRLATVDPDAGEADRLSAYADAMLSSLLASQWLPRSANATGLLHGQSFNIPADNRQGTYVWGDTYLLCALSISGRQNTSIC